MDSIYFKSVRLEGTNCSVSDILLPSLISELDHLSPTGGRQILICFIGSLMLFWYSFLTVLWAPFLCGQALSWDLLAPEFRPRFKLDCLTTTAVINFMLDWVTQTFKYLPLLWNYLVSRFNFVSATPNTNYFRFEATLFEHATLLSTCC
jgi:hypothetical protein